MKMIFKPGDLVHHSRHGLGTVEVDRGETVLARFEANYYECQKGDLRWRLTAEQALQRGQWSPAREVVARMQADAILSINDTWGVFSRSNITLLPHQLWVCQTVNQHWPTQWLVADDVGLGKTIEAGLILWPLISRKVAKRILILTPASLASQWRSRLFEMFDLRFVCYSREQDLPRSHFWSLNDQVIASLHTMRDDRGGRHDRLLRSEPWDLVMVDEAHHLNFDESGGATLGYHFLQKLRERATSMVFFSGTPHRGKNYSFLALLELLRPDLFDRRAPIAQQLPKLRQVMIRNNKENVTDLKGKRLFHRPTVKALEYRYGPEEAYFYQQMTSFIEGGLAYAKTLGHTDGQAVQLVLTAMQKLASSSVSAIRRAVQGRLERIGEKEGKIQEQLRQLSRFQDLGEFESASSLEEQIAESAGALQLMQNEAPHLRSLLEAAARVTEETKIARILSLIEDTLGERPILFFTEYKATQSLLLSALLNRHGPTCASFINGEDQARGVLVPGRGQQTLTETRESAASRFNSGEIRYLISTEAGGEGIDLQERCWTLVHVDLPWNPMRLHQRVGRLNRYGQERPVEVFLFRNPENVETRIWEILDEKLSNIDEALAEVMEDPEELRALVLGTVPAGFFEGIFANASKLPREQQTRDGLSKWFDKQSGQLGGKDVLEMVRGLVGNVTKFDYQQASSQLPRLDLPALKPFLVSYLQYKRKRVQEDDEGLSFNTPEEWQRFPGVPDRFEHLVFDRSVKGQLRKKRLVGIGHRAVDLAVEEARGLTGSICRVDAASLRYPLALFRYADRVTGEERSVRFVMVAAEVKPDACVMLRDWEFLEHLNQLCQGRALSAEPKETPISLEGTEAAIRVAQAFVDAHLDQVVLPFKVPVGRFVGLLWPC